jgi:porin
MFALPVFLTTCPTLALAQGAGAGGSQGATSPYESRLRCKAPNSLANPHKRKFGCKDVRFDTEETLSSDWNGARSALRDYGITPTASYVAALQTSSGGNAPQVSSYAAQLSFSLDFNLHKIFEVPGLSFFVSAFEGSGGNLSATINSTFSINTLRPPGFFLGEMFLQESFGEAGRFLLAAGRIAANAQFATLPVLDSYVNAGFNASVGNIDVNDPAFRGPPPGLEWGSQIVWQSKPLEISAGVFNNNLPSALGIDNGAHFTLQNQNKGALILGQVTYLLHQGSDDTGLPGEYNVGAFHDSNWFTNLAGSNPLTGISGLYVMGQQMIWQPSGRTGMRAGLTVWGEFGYSAPSADNTIPSFYGAGVAYAGLIPQRSRDSLNIGWIYGGFSRFLAGQTVERVYELNYHWNPTRWLNVLPDFQYVFRPSGFNVPGAAVLGVQLNVTL